MPSGLHGVRHTHNPDARLLRKMDEWPFPEEIAKATPYRLIRHGPSLLTKLASLLAIDDDRQEIRQSEVMRVIEWAMDDSQPDTPERDPETIRTFAERLIVVGWEPIVRELLIPTLETDTTLCSEETAAAVQWRAERVLRIVLALLKEVPFFKLSRVQDLFKRSGSTLLRIVKTLSEFWHTPKIGGLALEVYNQLIQVIPSPCVVAMGLVSEDIIDSLVWLVTTDDIPYSVRRFAVVILDRRPISDYLIGLKPSGEYACERLWRTGLPNLRSDSFDKRGELVVALSQSSLILSNIKEQMIYKAILWVSLELGKPDNTDEKIRDVVNTLVELGVNNCGVDLLDPVLTAGALPELAKVVYRFLDISEYAGTVTRAMRIISSFLVMYKGNYSRARQDELVVGVLESCDGFMLALGELLNPVESNMFFADAVTLLGHVGRVGASEGTTDMAFRRLSGILTRGVDHPTFMNLMTFVVKKFGNDDDAWRSMNNHWEKRLMRVVKDSGPFWRLTPEAVLCLFKTGYFESHPKESHHLGQVVGSYLADPFDYKVDKIYQPILKQVVNSIATESLMAPTTRQRRRREPPESGGSESPESESESESASASGGSESPESESASESASASESESEEPSSPSEGTESPNEVVVPQRKSARLAGKTDAHT